MPNPHRGEIEAVLGGRRLKLCLTLGALAEIEAALAAGDLTALGARLGGGALSARDIVAILGAAARGAGEAVSDAEIAALPVAGGLDAFAQALAALFAATFGEAPNPR